MLLVAVVTCVCRQLLLPPLLLYNYAWRNMHWCGIGMAQRLLTALL
jgi:hypothetical protein